VRGEVPEYFPPLEELVEQCRQRSVALVTRLQTLGRAAQEFCEKMSALRERPHDYAFVSDITQRSWFVLFHTVYDPREAPDAAATRIEQPTLRGYVICASSGGDDSEHRLFVGCDGYVADYADEGVGGCASLFADRDGDGFAKCAKDLMHDALTGSATVFRQTGMASGVAEGER
jgi:hypothetical protein